MANWANKANWANWANKPNNFLKLPTMKIFAVGMNYAEHNKSLNETLSKKEGPVIFTKADSALLKDKSLSSFPMTWERLNMKRNSWYVSVDWGRPSQSASLIDTTML